MEIVILGCGSASGVPVIGCKCRICREQKPRNRRFRSSIYVKKGDTSVVIDTGPDFRTQCLENGINNIDAAIYTHSHADHLLGIDDLKSFNFRKGGPVDIYLDPETAADVENRFGYLFNARVVRPNFSVVIAKQNLFYDRKLFSVGELEFLPIYQKHGKTFSYSFRFENVAYSTDFSELSEQNLADLKNLDLWIVDCIGRKQYLGHSNLDRTLGYIEQIKPKRAILTHLSHEIDYYDLRTKLPENVEVAYDGMKLC